MEKAKPLEQVKICTSTVHMLINVHCKETHEVQHAWRCACTVQYQHICMRAFKKQNTLYYLLLKALLQCMFRSYSTVCVWQYIITVIAAAQKISPE